MAKTIFGLASNRNTEKPHQNAQLYKSIITVGFAIKENKTVNVRYFREFRIVDFSSHPRHPDLMKFYFSRVS